MKNINDMSMSEKLSILLMQLDEATIASIFSRMNTNSIETLTSYMIKNKNIDKNILSKILEEFYAISQSNQYINSGGMDYAKEILYKALGQENAKKIIEKLIKSNNNNDFSYLSKIKPQQLSEFISKEHPQTIALILSHMDSTQAAEVLNLFSEDLRTEVSIRIAKLGEISPSIIKKISVVLEKKLENYNTTKIDVGGFQSTANIINKMGSKISKETIQKIAEKDPELAETLKGMLFQFEDIRNLNRKSLIEIIKNVDKKDLLYSFKLASEELKKSFFSVMSEKAKENFKEEMKYVGALKVKEIEESQKRIINKIMELSEKKLIEINNQEEEMID